MLSISHGVASNNPILFISSPQKWTSKEKPIDENNIKGIRISGAIFLENFTFHPKLVFF
jgi:hypothetical protein